MLNTKIKLTSLALFLLVAILANGQTREEIYEKIIAYADSGNYEQGELYVKQIISLDSTDEYQNYYWSSLGWFQHQLGQHEEALESYSTSIRLNSMFDEAFSNRAFVYMDMNELQNAKMDNIKALEINPLNDQALYNMGLILTKEEKYIEAIGYYQRLITINPAHYSAGLNLAYLKHTIGEFTQALMDYNRMIEHYPNEPILYNNMADLFLQMLDYTDALKFVNIALEIKPDFALALATKGQIYYYQEDYLKACIYFNKALANGFQRSRLSNYLDQCEPDKLVD